MISDAIEPIHCLSTAELGSAQGRKKDSVRHPRVGWSDADDWNCGTHDRRDGMSCF
ncbi:MAG: hypothetical protein ACI30A_03200 [Paludibacteraceae bacterium]